MGFERFNKVFKYFALQRSVMSILNFRQFVLGVIWASKGLCIFLQVSHRNPTQEKRNLDAPRCKPQWGEMSIETP